MSELNREQEQITNSNSDLYGYVKRIVAAVKYKGECDHEDVPSILRKFAEGYEQKIKKLTEENERLIADCAKGANALIEEMLRSRAIKADSVRKMQEIITTNYAVSKVHYAKDEAPTITYQLTNWQLDQIAKEMLEGAK